MRLVTRADFDGIVCAALLEELGVVGDYKFVHPKDVQDGKIPVDKNDVLANVPYAHGCGLWFDHHSSEMERLKIFEKAPLKAPRAFKGASRGAPSCARVVYDYYSGEGKFEKFDRGGLMDAIDKSDSAAFNRDEILHPNGWVLLSFVMDARTGLGRYQDYKKNTIELATDMIKYLRTMNVDEILEVEDVKERIRRYFKQEEPYKAMIQANSRANGNVLALDMRNVTEFFAGNRFIEYALFPDQNVSVRAIWGKDKQNVVFTVGYSIINKTCKTDIGSLMLEYGGGGHEKVGTCQVPVDDGDRVFGEIVERLREKE